MPDGLTAAARVQEAFPQGIIQVGSMQGVPMLRLRKPDVPAVARYIHTDPELRGSLSLLWAIDHRPREARDELWYLFTLAARKDWLLLTVDLAEEEREFASITPMVHAAKWYEREIRDLFGLIPVGHPDMRRLVRHEHWPKGMHPLKKEFAWDQVLERAQGEYAFRKIHGDGVFEIPVGPIHAGIIEPGHFRFSVAGEPILQLEVRHFWKHRGVEKLFEQQRLTEAVPLAERVSGDTSVGHSLAYCQAVETLLGMTVPPRARYLRSLFLELERLHNHIGDVGAICNDTAYALAHAHCGRLKEQLMQLNDGLTGSRFLRGVNRVGGVSIDLSGVQLSQVDAELQAIEQEFSGIEKILLANASLTERLENTGVLSESIAWDHAVMGVVGRASGIDRDLRRDRPFAAYPECQPKVAVYRYGDVRARMRVRLDEVHDSMRLIHTLRRQLPMGPLATQAVEPVTQGQWAISAVEGWRGEILYVVMAGEEGRIHRCKVRDPSFVHWPAIQWAALGNIVPDFPLINKSFNLSYAGNDL
ncbi:MAG TPA: NADH-quinone oxidoreductase subunit C [Nitrospira sp.]|nr:NADH-quinone oxidoreductase subunit C [Nitrospira sp.]MCW5794142.1 NADH-quinone oxidoreductase subunit C [Nitrospira sp.]HMW85451.1 NADH-quinone oxidoreductase subunit C [Nitrospira sp.]HMX91356.1 NADH-quinone oxidoreductase subunit C [Nitrospira sp.]HMZ96642.1 NADH-quinone oxidoreductase subunit C [Nitrospira sp.]